MRTSLIFLVFTFLYGCATTYQGFKNANLIQDLPLPTGEWTSIQVNDKNGLKIIWEKNGSDDYAMTSVAYAFVTSNISFKEFFDREIKDSCDEFSSIVVSEQLSNNYQSVIWKTVCQKRDGFIMC